MVIRGFGLMSFLLVAIGGCYSQTASLSYDTSRIAIIPFEKSMIWIFAGGYKAAKLTQTDITEIDEMYNKSIINFNSKLSGNGKAFTIDPKPSNYRRQYICVINEKGQKEVFVNCFCDSFDHDWKNEVIEVADGGNCYFNFKINLATRNQYEFSFNSVA
jgi:hypothetical protein